MTNDESFSNRIGDNARQQADRTNGVVVARNRVSELVRVSVRVEDSNNGDAELLSFLDRKVLALGVNNPECTRGLGEVTNSTKRCVKLDELTALHEEFLLGEAL